MKGEQLVRQQEDPLQEEHCEGSGGGQHVRRQGRGRRHQPRELPRAYDEPRVPVEHLQWRGLRIRRRLLVKLHLISHLSRSSIKAIEMQLLLKANKISKIIKSPG